MILETAWEAGGKAGAAAMRMWGRWLLRVRGRAHESSAHFERAYARYQGQAEGPGFLYWAAKAHIAAGNLDGMTALFERWRRTPVGAKRADLYEADLLVHSGKRLPRAAKLLKALTAHKDAAPYTHYLLGRLLFRLGDFEGSEMQVKVALEREPKKMLFRNFLNRVKHQRR